jgi:tetratricopeptide (TPR) repeat protein
MSDPYKMAYYEKVYDEGKRVIGLWFRDPEEAQNLEGKLQVLLSLEGLPIPSNTRVVPNTFDDQGGCFVMFESARAPGETDAEYRDSSAADVWFQKGVDAARRGDFREALRCFDEVVARRPRSAEAWNNKAFALANLNRNEEAIECCDKAIEIRPSYADPWDIKGRVLGRLGRYREAMPAIEKFVELAPPQHADRVQQARRALASLRARFGS